MPPQPSVEPQLRPEPVERASIKPRTPQQQSWGTIVSIVIIVLMIVVGAFYAWGKRVAEERALTEQINSNQ